MPMAAAPSTLSRPVADRHVPAERRPFYSADAPSLRVRIRFYRKPKRGRERESLDFSFFSFVLPSFRLKSETERKGKSIGGFAWPLLTVSAGARMGAVALGGRDRRWRVQP